MIVADTDVLIDFLNGKNPAADRVALEPGAGLKTTVITRFELLSAAQSRRQSRVVEELLKRPIGRPRCGARWNKPAWASAWPAA